ncbi:MAG: Hsp33 family molecular chaperone HslO [Gammaproteobacteria bacterium]|nr:Hsp33 family molecular chaperone HslO [Gammaproteobacteria bacterium]
MTTANQDLLHRYIFEQRHVRGELVQVTDSFNEMLKNHNYPDVVERVLGELLAATSLLTATLKFEGDISVQIQGDGALNYAVVNGNHKQEMRAAAKFSDDIKDGTIPELIGSGFMVITISPDDGERYQGVAELSKDSLAECIENYFETSEQLKTRVWLATEVTEQSRKAAGMLLQILPVEESAVDDFTHLEALTNTITDDELLNLPAKQVLTRLYHEDNPVLFEPQPVTYKCGCSREKTGEAILKLTYDDALDLVAERGNIEIICQFCLTQYLFDEIDVKTLFQGTNGLENQNPTSIN